MDRNRDKGELSPEERSRILKSAVRVTIPDTSGQKSTANKTTEESV